ncbi:hypothetical protein NKH86_32390 [Mesorhizobium sp. M0913]|uniref:hypothetical protein n=1 Tax=Mesorhizobium sp. M0913 TaxID=2957026 RepID=UPI00333D0E13
METLPKKAARPPKLATPAAVLPALQQLLKIEQTLVDQNAGKYSYERFHRRHQQMLLVRSKTVQVTLEDDPAAM